MKQYNFSVTQHDGKVVELKTPTETQTLLLNVLKESGAAVEKKKLAADILDWFEHFMAEQVISTPLDGAAFIMLAESNAHALWTWPETFQLKAIKGNDGTEHLQFTVVENPVVRTSSVPKTQSGEQTRPTQAMTSSVAGFEPAIPLPAIPVSDVEKQAVNSLTIELNARYNPDAVSRRVAKLEAEARELRQMRSQNLD